MLSQILAKEILLHCDNDHDAVLTFDEFIPWYAPVGPCLHGMLKSEEDISKYLTVKSRALAK